MAINNLITYPSLYSVDPAYPQGKAKNIIALGGRDGAAWDQDLVNDMFGFHQALLLNGTVELSGVPDTANESDYLKAVTKFERGLAMASNWTLRQSFNTNLLAIGHSGPLDQLVAVGADAIQRSNGGIVWVNSTPGSAATLNGVVFSDPLGMWFAVGAAGEIQFSSDGIGWTTTFPAGSTTFQAIAWSPSLDLMCAVGNSGVIFTSSDGTVWTLRTSQLGQRFNDVIWIDSLNLFVAVGVSGTIETSPNGIDWTDQTPATAATLNGVAYSPDTNRIVVVGNNGQIDSSTDGVAWAEVQTGGTNLNAISWGSVSLFVAVGDSGHIKTSRFGDSDWQDRFVPSGDSDLEGIVYDETNGSFVNGGESSVIQQSKFFGANL